MGSKDYNQQFEQALVEEASRQFIALLDESMQMLRLQQGFLLLDLGYDQEGRERLCKELAANIIRTGVTGLSAEALSEALGEVLLTELIYRSAYERHTYEQSCLLLQRSPEFRAYVKRNPPVTQSTRRDRPSSTESGREDTLRRGPVYGQDGEAQGLDDEVPEVPHTGQRLYYHRGVGSRPGRTTGRTRWPLRRPVSQP